MSDLIFLAVIVGFFAVAYGLLRACERIIGPDTAPAVTSATTSSAASGAGADPVEVPA